MNSYVIYADTEAVCPKKATTWIKKKTPCSFGSLLVDRTTGKSVYESSRGTNCIENFFAYIRRKATDYLVRSKSLQN